MLLWWGFLIVCVIMSYSSTIVEMTQDTFFIMWVISSLLHNLTPFASPSCLNCVSNFLWKIRVFYVMSCHVFLQTNFYLSRYISKLSGTSSKSYHDSFEHRICQSIAISNFYKTWYFLCYSAHMSFYDMKKEMWILQLHFD